MNIKFTKMEWMPTSKLIERLILSNLHKMKHLAEEGIQSDFMVNLFEYPINVHTFEKAHANKRKDKLPQLMIK